MAVKTSAVIGLQLCGECTTQVVRPEAESKNGRVFADQSSEVTSKMSEKEVKRRFPMLETS